MRKKRPSPYTTLNPDSLIPRDHLALDRTRLANERTLLAWVRTGIAFLVTGGTVMKFLADEPFYWYSGLVFIVIAFVVFVLGGLSFYRFKKRMDAIYQKGDSG